MPNPPALLQACFQRLEASRMLALDRAGLQRRLQALVGRVQRNQPIDRSLAEWEQSLAKHEARWKTFQASIPALNYPEELPVSRERERILAALAAHPVLIVCGDTGSGKTTQLPKMVYEAGGGHFGKIGVTQPRRLAATGMARRVAEECACELGGTVGVRVRFEDRTTENTRIQFMTDGILLAQLPHDPDWLEYNTLIIDEAHERSLNIDFILGCLHTLLQRRADLKVVISSATLDADRFSAFFGGAPVISVEGRLFPIEDIHLPEMEESDLDTADQILEALQRLDSSHGSLDTLVFLPGEREIRETAKKLEGHYRQRAEIMPLFARLSLADQQRVFATSSRRRIVLATNVAETSITLPGIRAVIDTGHVRVQRFHPQSQIQRLMTERVSQASARQRRGRCGRTGPGVCIRLYSEESLEKAPAYADPEIRRDSLAEVILRMAVLGLPPLGEFPLLDPPRGAQVAEGYRTLFEIGAMTERRQLTDRGRELARFPLEPRLARMLEEGHHEQVLPAVLVCVALLSIQDPRERPADQSEAADRAHGAWKHPDSDFLGILALWNALCGESASRGKRTRFCKANFLNPRRIEEWINLVDDLREICAEHNWKVPASIGEIELMDTDGLHRSLLSGVPKSLGERGDDADFRTPNGQAFRIFPGSALSKKPPRWVMAFTLLETSRLFARECAKLNPEWIEQVAAHLCSHVYERPVWNAARGFVEAEERVVLGQLTLRFGTKVHYGRVNPEEARTIFIRDGLAPGDLPPQEKYLKAYRRVLESLELWERKLRRPGWFVGSDALVAHFERVLPAEVCSVKDFQEWSHGRNWVPRISDLLEGTPCNEDAYPDEMTINGVSLRVHYAHCPAEAARDGATFEIREQDLGALPEEFLEWTLPAWLAEKVEALIRSLDKPLRNLCNPGAQTAREALAWFDENDFRYTHSLHRALAAFLAAKLGRILAAPDLKPDTLPPHLVSKLRVIDASGKVIHEGPTFPGARPATASGAVAARRSGTWHRSRLAAWPEDIPETCTENGRTLFPALVDETKTVGLRVFAAASEANDAHRGGVLRLFALLHPDPVRFLEKRFPLPTSVQLDLAQMRALPDLIEGVLTEALGLDHSLPRTEVAFHAAADKARGILFDIAEKRGEALRRIFDLRAKVNDVLDEKLPESATSDLAFQQEMLWTAGWCRDPENLSRYPRYLQGILARVERLRRDPLKDLKKQNEVDPALGLLATHAGRLGAGRLREAFRKIEELRLTAFAPELRPYEKMSAKRFAEWIEA